MRTAGISYRDTAEVIKITRQYDISHAAIQRHEVNGHFSVDAVLASALPAIGAEELTMKTIVTHKLRLWWAQNKDIVPPTKEIQDWLKLSAQFIEADKARAEAEQIRQSFIREAPVKAIGA